MNVLAVIPARYGSSRLPGKPLVRLAGKPMVQHVWERVCRAKNVSRVVVATDDERVVRAVREFCGEAFVTRSDHRSGTERVAEVAAQSQAEICVNAQGDEPLIEPAAVEAAVEAVASDPAVGISTLCTPIVNAADIADPNVVKVVLDARGDALYFSRAPIPCVREAAFPAKAGTGGIPPGAVGSAPAGLHHRKHLGLYAFRRRILLECAALPLGVLEQLEQLEQLRWLAHGYKIRVIETPYDSVSVDVPEDVPRVEKLLCEKSSQQVPRG